jgi:hypothetical protein
MTAWILIIWMTGGSSSSSIPLRIDGYSTKDHCEQAAKAWLSNKASPHYAVYGAACIPGPR